MAEDKVIEQKAAIPKAGTARIDRGPRASIGAQAPAGSSPAEAKPANDVAKRDVAPKEDSPAAGLVVPIGLEVASIEPAPPENPEGEAVAVDFTNSVPSAGEDVPDLHMETLPDGDKVIRNAHGDVTVEQNQAAPYREFES